MAADAPSTPAAPFTYHETQILGTSLDMQVAALSKDDADKCHAAILAEINRLRKILSTHEPDTDLAKVNASGDAVKVAPEVIEVLKLYDDWFAHTEGAFSGRIGGLISLWQDAAAAGRMPTRAAVDTQVAANGKPLWKIDEVAGTVRRLGDSAINIDSLGKGFIVSRAATAGKNAARGVHGLLLNIGGDITAMGSRSSSVFVPWTLGIADPAHPADNAKPLTQIKITDMSVATSGSYDRNFQIGAAKLSHIIDPRNGYPIDSVDVRGGLRDPLVVSATVIAPDNAIANAVATSLCVMTPEQGLALIGTTPDAEALIVLSSGKEIRSKGFKNYETTAVAAAGKGWPNGAQVSIALQQNTNIRERPYMAVWIENAKGDLVATLAEWGSQRYVSSLSNWMRQVADDPNFRAMTRATRPAGKYTLVWDGKDSKGNPVPPGTYKIFVEAAYEH
ncbi:MAG TPA: DUF2271 domain-containing protein, partial [Phycisphaerae bacterium]